MLLIGAAVLLLIVCANVGNLLIVRLASRRHEFAVRAAVGANPRQLIGQLLRESVGLAMVGGLAGMLATWLALPALRALMPADLPRIDDVGLNGTVLLVSMLVSLGCGLAFGVLPAIQLKRESLDASLREGGRNAAGFSRHRIGRALVVAEVALSLTLLAGAGVLVKSFQHLLRVDPGFVSENALTARLRVSGREYAQPDQRIAFMRAFDERVKQLPGVTAVGATSQLPLSGEANDEPFRIAGRSYEGSNSDLANQRIVTPGFIGAMKIPLVSGRWFDDRDTATSPPVVVVNAPFVERYFGSENPIGARIRLMISEPDGPDREIIGVVGGVHHTSLETPSEPEKYLPYAQRPFEEMNVIVRTTGNPLALAPDLRRTLAAMDNALGFSPMRTLDDVVAAALARSRFSAQLLGAFAVLALFLAALGLYALIAYTVRRRFREFAVRVAMGAPPGRIARLVLRQGMTLVLVGIALGLAGSFALQGLLRGLLYEVSPADPLVIGGVVFVLTAVAALACLLPAMRAARVDPNVALRD